MSKIKNIIFDLGGVLLTEDDDWLYSEDVKNLLYASDEEIIAGWQAAWPDAKLGKIDEDKFFEIFLKVSTGSYNQELVNKLKMIFRNHTGIYTAYPFLENLKDDYDLYALTNISSDWLEYKRKTFNLDKYLKLITSSCGEGIAKPDKGIYEALIEKGNINPNQSVFVDNLKRNLPPAEDFGFKVILYENPDRLVKDLGNLGIEL